MRGRPYPPEIRDRAVRMVEDRLPDSTSTWAAVETVAGHLGLHPNTVRAWHRQARAVTGERPLLPSEQDDEITRLRGELAAARALNAGLVADRADTYSGSGPYTAAPTPLDAAGAHRWPTTTAKDPR